MGVDRFTPPGSPLTSNQYCMPVLGLIFFLRYAFGRIYEYFLNKFPKSIASDDGMFFTPKSLVKMIANILEPKSGMLHIWSISFFRLRRNRNRYI